ncbi:MAG: GNAT family N-acetyltransferase [Actinomycetota bacterium]
MSTVDADTPDAVEVTTWHLEITEPADLPDPKPPRVEAAFVIGERPTVEYCRWLYAYVGAPWHWTDRRDWTDEQWRERIDAPGYHLVTCVVGGTPAGYVEFVDTDGDVEIVSFGLATDMHGHGVGGWFLAEAVRYGFALDGARRVWLHTCSLDGPNARANYEARGFRLFDTEVGWRVLD